MRWRIYLASGLKVSSLVLLVALVFSCGRGANRLSLSSPSDFAVSSSSNSAASEISLSQVFLELQGLSYQGKHKALFNYLKRELFALLSSKKVSKFASKPPQLADDAISDLDLDEGPGKDEFTLSWSYRNTGDFSQDGKVDMLDLFPLADHFFHAVGLDALDEVIDVSKNGKVDMPDIFPLAENFFSNVITYRIKTSETSSGPFTTISEVPFSSAVGEGRKKFYFVSNEFTPGFFIKVVPVDADGEEGVESNLVQVPTPTNQPPTASLSASPLQGPVPLLVNFDASGSYDSDGSIVKYEWDFEGDGSYDEEGVSPTTEHTYTSPSLVPLPATVRVTDDDGATDTASVLILPQPFGEPPMINSLAPLTGIEGTNLTFVADVSGTPPFDFFFEFEPGSVTPDFVEGSSADTVFASVLLGPPGTYIVTVSVSNTSGKAEQDFTFSIEPAQVSRGDWWMLGREPSHQRRSPFLGPQLPDSFLWKRISARSNFAPSPVVGADGTIYIGGGDGSMNKYLFAINPDGSDKWRFQTLSSGDFIDTSPAIGRDGTIYLAAGRRLYAIEPSSGTSKWVFDAGDYILSSPAIAEDGTIYFGCNDDSLYAVYPHGELRWRYQANGDIKSSPAIDADGNIYFGSEANALYAVSSAGSLLWSQAFPLTSVGTPSIVEGLGDSRMIYVANGSQIFSLTGEGVVTGTFSAGDTILSSPAIGEDGTIYFGSNDDKLYALNPDLTEKWNFATGGDIKCSPAIGSDGTIYFVSDDYFLYALSPDGALKWSYSVSELVESALAISQDGILLVSTMEGSLFAFKDISPEPPVASLTADVTSGYPPLLVNFDASGSYDPDGTIVKFEWDWEGDGIWDLDTGTEPTAQHAYVQVDQYEATVRVTDNEGFQDTESITITVSEPPNAPPTADLNASPRNGKAPLPVLFDASQSQDPDGTIVLYEWDWEGDGTYDEQGSVPLIMHVYTEPGIYEATVRVTDNRGATDTDSVTITVTSMSQGDWWMFGRNPQHQSRSPYRGPQSANVRWSIPIGVVNRSSPSIGGDGTIYIGSQENALYAIAPSGTIKWEFPVGDFVFSGPAVGTDGTIYFGVGGVSGADNKLYAVNPDGTEKWSFQTGGKINGSPAIDPEGTIYFGSADFYFYALNPDGTEKWKYQTGDYVFSSPAIALDGTIYVGSNDSTLYAFYPDGNLKWKFEEPTSYIISSPAIADDGTIYFGCSDGNVYAVNPDGSQKWVFSTGDDIWSKPAIGPDGTIYVGSWDGYLYAISPDGSLKWRYQTAGAIYSHPAVDLDGTIYFAGGSLANDRNLYALTPGGMLKWSYEMDGSVTGGLAISEDGTLYVGTENSSGNTFWAFHDP